MKPSRFQRNRCGHGRSWSALCRICLAIALTATLSRVAYAQQASIEGIVHDALGRPVPGAAVTLQSAEGAAVAKTASGSDGRFRFDGVPAGTYAVLVAKSDFEPGSTIVSANETGTTNVELALQASKALNLAVVSKRLDESRNSLNPSVGASTYTMTSDSIQAMPQGAATPFSQVLLRAPGVAEDSAASGLFHVRGEHANVQTRLNGILLPEGIIGFGQVVDSAIVDRVSLITGTLPAQYGLRTAGIVDIQTKDGAFSPGGYVDLYGGTNETLSPSAAYGGSAGSFSYFVTGSYLTTDQGIEGPTSAFKPVHDYSDQSKGLGYFSYLLNPTTRLVSIIGTSITDFQIPNNPNQTTCGWANPAASSTCNPNVNGTPIGTINSASIKSTQREENYFATIALQGTAGVYDYQVAVYDRYSLLHYVPDVNAELEFNGAATDALRTNSASGAQADVSYRASDSHTIRTGFLGEQVAALATGRVTVFPSTLNPDGTYTQLSNDTELVQIQTTKVANLYGAYLQDEWKLDPAFTVNYGARFDVSDAFLYETQLSPRLGVVWEFTPQWTLHAGYAKTFTPPPVELIAPTQISAFNGTTNQPLTTQDDPVKSESADSYDAGIIYKPTTSWALGWDNYYKDVRHLLDEGQFGAALVLTPFNYARGYIYGSELTGSYTGPRLTAYANFAYSVAMGTQIESAQFNFVPDELAYIQNHYVHLDHDQTYTASWGLAYLVAQDTRLGFDALYGSGLRNGFANTTHLPDYTVVNVFATEHLHMIDEKGLDLRFTVVNVFDEVYELRDGTGIGVGAPQFGPRVGYFAGVRKPF